VDDAEPVRIDDAVMEELSISRGSANTNLRELVKTALDLGLHLAEREKNETPPTDRGVATLSTR